MGSNIIPRRLIINKPILPISLGGTNGSTVQEAISNLKLIPNSFKDEPIGVALLDINRLVKEQNIPAEIKKSKATIEGLITLGTDQQEDYLMTDYCSFKTYVLSTDNNKGSISRVDDVLTYTAPHTPGSTFFKVNDFEYPVSVFQSVILKPSIISPSNNLNGVQSSLIIQGSAFTTLGRTDTFDIEEISLVNFIPVEVNSADTPIFEILPRASNSAVWKMSNLRINRTYSIRIRYKGLVLGYSEWSDTISFTTADKFIPTNEISFLRPSETAYGGKFGSNLDISNTGNIFIVGVPTATTFFPNNILDQYGNIIYYPGDFISGKCYIYTNINDSYVLTDEIIDSNKKPYDGMGLSVGMSSDGNRIASAKIVSGYTPHAVGSILIYTKDTVGWSLESEIQPYDTPNYDYSFIKLDLDDLAETLAFTCYVEGSVYIYIRTGTAWDFSYKIKPLFQNYSFGFRVSISNLGNRIAITSNAVTPDTWSVNCGVVYVYRRAINDNWVLEQAIVPDVVDSVSAWGEVVKIANNGSRLFVQAYEQDISNHRGRIYVFNRIGTTWQQDTILSATDGLTSNTFGLDFTVSANGNYLIAGNSSEHKLYYFVYNNGTWSLINKLDYVPPLENYGFADTLSISNDGNVLLIGSPDNSFNLSTMQYDYQFSSAGGVYIFK